MCFLSGLSRFLIAIVLVDSCPKSIIYANAIEAFAIGEICSILEVLSSTLAMLAFGHL